MRGSVVSTICKLQVCTQIGTQDSSPFLYYKMILISSVVGLVATSIPGNTHGFGVAHIWKEKNNLNLKPIRSKQRIVSQKAGDARRSTLDKLKLQKLGIFPITDVAIQYSPYNEEHERERIQRMKDLLPSRFNDQDYKLLKLLYVEEHLSHMHMALDQYTRQDAEMIDHTSVQGRTRLLDIVVYNSYHLCNFALSPYSKIYFDGTMQPKRKEVEVASTNFLKWTRENNWDKLLNDDEAFELFINAALHGRTVHFKYLLTRHPGLMSRVSDQDDDGQTLLHFAVDQEEPNLEKLKTLLFDLQANIHIKNDNGESPIDIVKRRHNSAALQLFQAAEIELGEREGNYQI